MPDASYWAVARVHNEGLARICLAERGYSVFAPQIETRRRTLALLFPSHIFVLVVSHWMSANRAPGVVELIRFGEHPARCPTTEIEALKARLGPNGVIALPPPPPPPPKRIIKPGARVRVIDGPFRGLNGIFQGQTSRDRILVLMSVLNAARPVKIHAASIAPI
jgi:transcriptional antiterminator RfaH